MGRVLGAVATVAAAALVGAGVAAHELPRTTWLGPRVETSAAGNVVRRGTPRVRTFPRGPAGSRGGATALARVALRDADRRRADLSVRQMLEQHGVGTYIGELLRQRDSSLTRWPDRADRPVAVHVADGSALDGWRPEYVRQVASAFAEWTRAGVPLTFRLVDDSSRADVHVGWTDRFREPISGRTVWSRDDRWWIVDGQVTLALHHNDGVPLDADQVRAIALHEVGHLLGLDHTASADNVMAPRVRVRQLSDADQATARLLYTVPAGRVR